jgi:hypothetical protein
MVKHKKKYKKTHRPIINARKLRKEELLKQTKIYVYKLLDERVPNWRIDPLLKVRVNEIIREEVEIKVDGFVSSANMLVNKVVK